MKQAVFAVTLVALLGACSTPAPTIQSRNASSVASEPLKGGDEVASSVARLPPHLDPTSHISKERSIYFDFDQYSIDANYLPVVEMHAKYLVLNREMFVKIVGNADERGSSEYNLALGQKRADAVMRRLKLLGVDDAQVETISFGKEKPKYEGHDEDAWSKNRRADIVYPPESEWLHPVQEIYKFKPNGK